MKRREFIPLVGGAAAMWPLVARAQHLAMPVVGFLTSLGSNDRPNLREGFRRGLRESSYQEGLNVAIEYRFAERQLLVLEASTPSEIDAAFTVVRQQRAGAVIAGGDPFFTARRQQIVALAARDAIPTMFSNRDYVVDGGLMSYGNDIPDAYRRAGLYVARILKGEKPGELPVDQATRFELVINLNTAKALGITLPPTLLARADEVIE